MYFFLQNEQLYKSIFQESNENVSNRNESILATVTPFQALNIKGFILNFITYKSIKVPQE